MATVASRAHVETPGNGRRPGGIPALMRLPNEREKKMADTSESTSTTEVRSGYRLESFCVELDRWVSAPTTGVPCTLPSALAQIPGMLREWPGLAKRKIRARFERVTTVTEHTYSTPCRYVVEDGYETIHPA